MTGTGGFRATVSVRHLCSQSFRSTTISRPSIAIALRRSQQRKTALRVDRYLAVGLLVDRCLDLFDPVQLACWERPEWIRDLLPTSPRNKLYKAQCHHLQELHLRSIHSRRFRPWPHSSLHPKIRRLSRIIRLTRLKGSGCHEKTGLEIRDRIRVARSADRYRLDHL